ncbi:BREX-1 system adenine-specific DNA-methyltransferase PglX [Methanothermobacter sp. KEPCO 2]|uniref:BREX-1 system adenine-specific DNA-methyltransferase PglX n=1 Tax=Methanothermobacter sp. KEPCO 2 TaxID=3240977 RepID=UPI0035132D61
MGGISINKKAIKTFAVEARKKLIDEIKYRASLLGITEEGISDPVEKIDGMEVYDVGGTPYKIYDEAIEQRKSLVKRINEKGFDNVIEEVAYTWFNRIIAIRFMEVNDYLPGHVRVLSSEKEGKIEPDIVTMAPDVDLDFSDEEIETVYRLKDENRLDELFRMLFIKQCNKLNEILPELFEETADYTEILLSISYTSEDGVVRRLVDLIPEDDFRDQVEIIGWMYQYYISEVKDQVINIYKGTVKKDDIPAATQLFTPEWIVKYMVDNSLGRYWMERNPNSKLKEKLEYYLDYGQEKEIINALGDEIGSISPEEIKFLDPCMGSGHILVYAFDVFVEIYRERGYPEREIPKFILKNNLFGMDIDDRAYQLAYFALMMKARSYSRTIFKKNIKPNICAFRESQDLRDELIDFIGSGDSEIIKELKRLRSVFLNAKELGSLIKMPDMDYINLELKVKNSLKNPKNSLKSVIFNNEAMEKLIPLLEQAKLLSGKYDVVVTNPPYLNKMDRSLRNYARSNYEEYSKDLFSMFIYRNTQFCKKHGYCALMTPFVWMFIKAYQKLRKFIVSEKSISSLIQLEYSAFSEATVPICTFVLFNSDTDYNGIYIKLSEFTGGMEVQRKKVLEAIKNPEVEYLYLSKKNKFLRIPGNPIAYWVSENVINTFSHGKELSSFAEVKQGLATADNKRFLRLWHEVDFNRCGFGFEDSEDAKKSGKKWFPYNKGGNFRKWYGNHEYLINWENDGDELRNFKKSVLRNQQYYFKKSLSWSKISSGKIAFRFFPRGFIFDVAGCSIFTEEDNCYLLGLLNSKVCEYILSFISPTLNYEVGHIASIPVIFSGDYSEEIKRLVEENIKLSKLDWDVSDTSWNFTVHPLLTFKESSIEKSFKKWDELTQKRFSKLKSNEEKLNEIFIKIYGLEDELTPEAPDSEVTIRKADLSRDIRSFISYAVGCIFGRYSLDEEGLVFAGGEWDPSRYSKFIPDEDNIIPILDTEYFEDDIVGRFIEFVRVTFGEEKLEENLDFIAKALGKRGKTSREIIRNYFMSDFYKDHVKTYKKRPIYWQFDSGKKNAFKALIYMHRYEPDLVARVRTEYLHRTQKAIENRIKQNERIIENSKTKSEISRLTKENKKLIEQLEEIKVYDEALAHIANRKIEIDLDDGVQVNYAKFQGVEIKRNGKTVKVDLLKKL